MPKFSLWRVVGATGVQSIVFATKDIEIKHAFFFVPLGFARDTRLALIICGWSKPFRAQTTVRPELTAEGERALALAKASRVVDLGGIGPPTNPCHGSVLPLYYRPLFGG